MVAAMRRYWADLVAVAGLACIAGGAYLVDLALGLLATGIALIVVAVFAELSSARGGDDVAA